MARLKIYNVATGQWEYVSFPPRGSAPRYVPIEGATLWDINAVIPAATGYQNYELALNVPANDPGIIAVNLMCMIRDNGTASGSAGGANSNMIIAHYDTTGMAGVVYTSGVGARGGNIAVPFCRVGGTNNRQIRIATSVASNAATIWIAAVGVWRND